MTDPSRASKLRRAQDQVRAEQTVVDLLRREVDELRTELRAKLEEMAWAEVKRAEAVATEARVFAETEGAQGR